MTSEAPTDAAATLATTIVTGGVCLCIGLGLAIGFSGLLVGIGLTILLGVIGSGLVLGLPKIADKLERLVPAGVSSTTVRTELEQGQGGSKTLSRDAIAHRDESPSTTHPRATSDGVAWLKDRST